MSESRVLERLFEFMKGNVIVLTITQSMGMFCRSMVFPYASLFIIALGGESAQIGFINSLRPLAGLLMFPIAGHLSDVGGRVKLIAVASFLSGVSYLMYVLAPTWEWIALGSLVQGFMVFQFPPTSAILADSLDPENRGMGIATMNTISSLLALFSPYIAGIALSIYGNEFGMRLLYSALASVYMISGLIHIKFLRETADNPVDEFSLSEVPDMFSEAFGGIPDLLGNLPLTVKALAVIMTLGFTSNAVGSPFWVVYVTDVINLSSLEWGLILLVESGLRTLLYIPAGVIVDRYGRARSLSASLFLSLIAVPLLVFSDSFFEVLMIRSAIGISNAIMVPASSALLADAVPRDIRGRAMAAIGRGSMLLGATGGGTGGPGMGYIITLPVVVMSIVGGYIYALNPSFTWGLITFTIFLSLVTSLIFVRDPKEAER
ncbi:MAG: MFS transporter [Candidatus Bathyarchaeia archaeon]